MTTRYRIQYKKTFELRYTAVLDMHKIWERYLRRAKLHLTYSQGFHPQPKLAQAAPLPLGFLSDDEFIDVWIEEDDLHGSIFNQLKLNSQPGIVIKNIEAIDLRAPSLPTLVIACEYGVEFLTPIPTDELPSKVEQLLSSDEIIRTRRNKEYDLRKLVQNLEPIDSNQTEFAALRMTLSALPGATGRPEEVLSAMGFDSSITRITRTKTVLKQEDPN